MPLGHQIVDELWHCLCSSFRSTSLLVGLRRIYPYARPLCRGQKNDPRQTALPIRNQSTIAAAHDGSPSHGKTEGKLRTKPFVFDLNLSQRPPGDPESRTAAVLRIGNDEELHQELLRRANAGDLEWVRHLVRLLLHERGEQPDVRHYYALLIANADAKLGSVEEAKGLLQDMENSQIPIDSSVYHAMLKVLSVHPMYTLRAEILNKMKQNWHSLTADGYAYVIAGLLRDKQVENALEYLSDMRIQGYEPPIWLVNLLLYATLSIGAFPEAESFLSLRISLTTPRTPITSALWSYILAAAAGALYHPLVTFVWDRAVTTSHFNPSSGLCTGVLDSCARAGDPDLATDVFRVLGQRSSPIAPHHYETLLECYIGADDLPSALTVLNIMAKSTNPPTDASARPLYFYLRSYPSEIEIAVSILQERAEKQDLAPICTINAIIEAHIHNNDPEAALEFYKIHSSLISPGVKPNTYTFNALLRGCSRDSRNDDVNGHSQNLASPTADAVSDPSRPIDDTLSSRSPNPNPKKKALTPVFVASEIRALGIKPDALTYDRLVGAYIDEGSPTDIDFAWRYFKEMKAVGARMKSRPPHEGDNNGPANSEWWLRRGTFSGLARKLAERADERVWRLLDEGAQMGMDVVALRRVCEGLWPEHSKQMPE